MRRLLLVAALLVASPATADLANMTEDERAAFREEVRAYLLENPELLMEAIGILEQRQAEAQVAADVDLVAQHADAIFKDGVSWVGGNPEGDVTMVEFLDYRCGYCRRAHPEITDLVETDGGIRYIVKEFPILGEQSVLASRFAIAVRNVAGAEVYEQVHDALMTLRADVTEPALRGVAEDMGLDAGGDLRRHGGARGRGGDRGQPGVGAGHGHQRHADLRRRRPDAARLPAARPDDAGRRRGARRGVTGRLGWRAEPGLRGGTVGDPRQWRGTTPPTVAALKRHRVGPDNTARPGHLTRPEQGALAPPGSARPPPGRALLRRRRGERPFGGA